MILKNTFWSISGWNEIMSDIYSRKKKGWKMDTWNTKGQSIAAWCLWRSIILSVFEYIWEVPEQTAFKKGDYYFCFTSFVWLSSPPQQGMIAHDVALKQGRLSLMSLMNAQAETVLFPKNLFHSSQLLLSLSLYLRWPLWDRGSPKCQRSPVVIHLTLHLVCHIHFFKVTCPSK